jgi:hypothetical protein
MQSAQVTYHLPAYNPEAASSSATQEQQAGIIYQPVAPGTTFVQVSNPTLAVTDVDSNEYKNTKILFIVGFFIHFAWVIAFFITRNKDAKSKRLGNFSCVMFFVSLVLIAIIIVAIAVPIAIANSTAYYYYTY